MLNRYSTKYDFQDTKPKSFLIRIGDYAKTKKSLNGIQNHLRNTGILTGIRAFWDLRNQPDEMLAMRRFVEENQILIKKVSDMLYDEKSRCVYNGIIDFRHTRNVKSIKPIMLEKDLYFVNDIISLSNEEVFIDGGAYDGDVTLEFIKRVSGKYKAIAAFEPSHDNFIKLKNNLSNASVSGVEVYEEGLWSEETTLTFFDDGSVASHVSGLGSEIGYTPETTYQIEVKVNTIDNTVFDKQPTFIKMDIEGSELEALRGAQKTIQRYKPKLAISLYHKKRDLIDIPLYIKELVPEYRIYVRHHSHYENETVLYAVI